jgi:cytochrome bd ubiquinol oxidase subunit II
VHLYAIPLVFALIGLILYTVLGGADFGAGMWQLIAGADDRAQRIRDHAHHSMAPVWEANHVWLVFVLTVMWTAYPTAFGSIASTLSVPLFIAAVGIIFRGAAYALRSGTREPGEVRLVDTIFAVSSILTPFALGTVVGGIAAGRVPVGNAAGHLISSWTSPISILIGALAVAASAYLAAVYLSADAVRLGEPELEAAFRARALTAGVVAGALAVGGLVVLHADAHRVFHRLIDGPGLPALIVSVLAGVSTLAFVWRRRFELARYGAALAVAAIIAGWALAQQPVLLPGLTIRQAAAPHDTLVLVVIAVLAGGAILFPSLAALFGLVLRGRFDPWEGEPPAAAPARATRAALGPSPPIDRAAGGRAPSLATRAAAACLIAGFGLLTVADAPWAHAVGVICLLAFVVIGFVAVAPAQIAAQDD